MTGVELYCQGEYDKAYPLLENEAKQEHPPGVATLYFAFLLTDRTRDRHYIDNAVIKVRGNVEEDIVEQSWGATLFDLGHHGEGLQHMRLAVQLDPNRTYNKMVLADRLICVNGYEEAIQLYNDGLKREPDSWIAYRGLARCYFDTNFKLSTRYAIKAVELNPYEPDLRYLLAYPLHKSGRIQEAIEQLHAAIDLGYQVTAEPLSAIAECYRDLGEMDQAIEYARQAIEASPDSDYAKQLLDELQKMSSHGSG
jgi:tetratricopeptide (TPR) repeat protein